MSPEKSPASTTAPCHGNDDRPPARPAFFEPDVARGGPVRASKMSRRRAWVLLLVHVLIFAHILHWKLKGTTLSPLEPSEAMYTVLTGAVNAGALLLLLSIGATLVFGRFFCGWLCHVVALQDGCAWLLKKLGIRPRPLRSRLLVFVPLIAGLYMLFVGPIMARVRAGQGAPEITMELHKSDFWATFPGPWVALITFVIAGFVMVYLLGAKGFCTYACPYGGLFGVADRLAPGRIRVTDACKACGHCTSVCTSNVIIHREVIEYGAVVDPGCMKCFDCVSVCPENALYYGFGKPAVLTKPRHPVKPRARHFAWSEEILMVATFAVSLAVFTGLPASIVRWGTSLNGQTPLLLSLGLAATASFALVMFLRLLRTSDVQAWNKVLKSDGRLRRGGWIAVIGLGAYLAFVFNAGFVQYHMWQGDRKSQAIDLHRLAFDPESMPLRADPKIRRGLDAARRHYDLVDRFGAVAFLDLRVPSRLAGLMMALGRTDDAAAHYRRALAIDEEFAPTHLGLGQAHWWSGRPDEALSHLERAFTLDPRSHEIEQALADVARQFANANVFDRARRCLEALRQGRPENDAYTMGLADILATKDGLAAAVALLRGEVERRPDAHRLRAYLGMYLFAADDVAGAIRELEAAVPLVPDFPAAAQALDAARTKRDEKPEPPR